MLTQTTKVKYKTINGYNVKNMLRIMHNACVLLCLLWSASTQYSCRLLHSRRGNHVTTWVNVPQYTVCICYGTLHRVRNDCVAMLRKCRAVESCSTTIISLQNDQKHSHVCDLIEHYSDVIMATMASQITSLTIVHSIVYSDADERKHQSSASLVFVWGINRWPVNSPHKGPVTRKMFPFDDVIMETFETMLLDYTTEES